MTKKLRTKIEYAGRYVSVNATPEVTIEKSYEGNCWVVTWGDHSERWQFAKDCRAVVEDVASMKDGEHCFPIKLS